MAKKKGLFGTVLSILNTAQTLKKENTNIVVNHQKRPPREKERPIKLINNKLYPTTSQSFTTRDFIDKYKNNIVVIDTETTGLKISDEMLQLSIIDYNGGTLFNQYMKPKTKKSWKEAQEVNHISPAKVRKEKTIDYYKKELQNILKNRIVIGYNIPFDYKFLIKEGLITKNYMTVDVMKPFAAEYGEYDKQYGNYYFQSLETCTEHFGYQWKGNAHDSLADALATLYCFECLKEIDLTFWKIITLEEEEQIKNKQREDRLKQKLNCKNYIELNLSNSTKAKWIDTLKPDTIYPDISFRLEKTKPNTKPPISMYCGSNMIGTYKAGTGVYKATKDFDNSLNYELYIKDKYDSFYNENEFYYKAYLLEK